MTDLVQKVKIFFIGTDREIVENKVKGIGWKLMQYSELLRAPALSYTFRDSPISIDRPPSIPKYVAVVYLLLDGFTRLAKAMNKCLVSSEE